MKYSANIKWVGQYPTLILTLYFLSFTKKYLTFICLEFPVHEFLQIFSMIMSLLLSWKKHCPLYCIPILSETSSTTDCIECTHSSLTVPSLLRSWHWYFFSMIFYGWSHIPLIWHHLCGFSCHSTYHTMYQSRWTLRSNLFLRLRAFLQLYSLPKLNLS